MSRKNKLNESQEIEVALTYIKGGYTYLMLAEIYRCSISVIRKAILKYAEEHNIELRTQYRRVLTDVDAIALYLDVVENNFTYKQVSEKYGLTITAARNVCTGQTYKHLELPVIVENKKRRFSDEQVIKIRNEIERAEYKNKKIISLADYYNVDSTSIKKIHQRRTYKKI